MKILLILILFLPSLGIGQHTLMISHNNEWITKIVEPFSPQISYVKKTFSEETMIIDGKEYKELLYVNFQTGTTSKTDDFYRELNKRVYYYDDQFDREVLIYDFNLSVGDTLSQLYFYGVTEPLMVQDVETIVLNDNKPRKKITLSCYPYYEHSLQMIWIEGIGVNTSIGSEILYCIHDVGSELNCFFQYGEHVYAPVNQNSCFQTVSNSENELNLYRIFPNPVQDYLNIEDLNTSFEYTIKTMEGKSIQRGQGEQRIEVHQLPAGMYVLEIVTENKIGVMKFVKR